VQTGRERKPGKARPFFPSGLPHSAAPQRGLRLGRAVDLGGRCSSAGTESPPHRTIYARAGEHRPHVAVGCTPLESLHKIGHVDPGSWCRICRVIRPRANGNRDDDPDGSPPQHDADLGSKRPELKEILRWTFRILALVVALQACVIAVVSDGTGMPGATPPGLSPSALGLPVPLAVLTGVVLALLVAVVVAHAVILTRPFPRPKRMPLREENQRLGDIAVAVHSAIETGRRG
jgi:hypothetical protein